MSQIKNRQNPWRLVTFILIAVVCGLAAGVLGEIATRLYITKDLSPAYFYGDLDVASLSSAGSSLVIRDPKKVVVSQDVKVSETVSSLRPALLGIFKEDGAGYYNLDEPLFVALAVTSDGWLAASLPEDLTSFSPKGYIAISSERKTYRIDKMSTVGDEDGLTFLHLAEASNLSVKKIVPRSELSLGQLVLVVDDYNNAVLTSISSFKRTPSILSSDYLGARLALASGLPEDFRRSFVFNLAGDLVAVLGQDQEAVPAFSYDAAWRSLLVSGSLSRPVFGVNYLDLSRTQAEGISLQKGAWLTATSEAPAVVKGSPAQKAGLQSGDIITWVNNQELGAGNDLAEIISGYQPGDSLKVRYVRNGEEKETTVVLAAAK